MDKLLLVSHLYALLSSVKHKILYFAEGNQTVDDSHLLFSPTRNRYCKLYLSKLLLYNFYESLQTTFPNNVLVRKFRG